MSAVEEAYPIAAGGSTQGRGREKMDNRDPRTWIGLEPYKGPIGQTW